MELVEIFKIYGEYGVGAVLFIVLAIGLRYSVKKNEACTEDQRKLYKEHKDEIKGITVQMFDVVNRNTESFTEFRDAVKDFGRR